MCQISTPRRLRSLSPCLYCKQSKSLRQHGTKTCLDSFSFSMYISVTTAVESRKLRTVGLAYTDTQTIERTSFIH